jgi:hypothetical protein
MKYLTFLANGQYRRGSYSHSGRNSWHYPLLGALQASRSVEVLAELKAAQGFNRRGVVEKAGWATLHGTRSRTLTWPGRAKQRLSPVRHRQLASPTLMGETLQGTGDAIFAERKPPLCKISSARALLVAMGVPRGRNGAVLGKLHAARKPRCDFNLTSPCVLMKNSRP